MLEAMREGKRKGGATFLPHQQLLAGEIEINSRSLGAWGACKHAFPSLEMSTLVSALWIGQSITRLSWPSNGKDCTKVCTGQL